jgi:tight adherence protein C
VGWDESSLRVRFMQAGLREEAWPAIYFAAKTVLALLWPGLFVLYQGLSAMQMTVTNTILVLVLLAALGYYLPNVLLVNLIKHRKREVEDALPDALDMMLVCVEAGLGLDAAMNRAAGEIGLRSQAMADELNLVALELRMGVKRDQALRNMALRTGVDDVASFVAMLVQADRFGTNVADALRIEAETMRTHRRLRAEERAAKIPLKLLFPLIFFIFPSLMLVLLGPAMISIYRVLLPTMSGG